MSGCKDGFRLAETSKLLKEELDVPHTISALLKVKDVKGLSGNITIDSDGATRSLEVVPVVFRDGNLSP